MLYYDYGTVLLSDSSSFSMTPGYSNDCLIEYWHYCNKYSCFVSQNTIIVSLLRHKTYDVEILQLKIASHDMFVTS